MHLHQKLGGVLHFIHCETRRLELAGELLQPPSPRAKRTVYVTGGGAFKSRVQFEEGMGITVSPVDEMDSIVEGLRFLRQYGPAGEVYSLVCVPGHPEAVPDAVPEAWPSQREACFVVNIGFFP